MPAGSVRGVLFASPASFLRSCIQFSFCSCPIKLSSLSPPHPARPHAGVFSSSSLAARPTSNPRANESAVAHRIFLSVMLFPISCSCYTGHGKDVLVMTYTTSPWSFLQKQAAESTFRTAQAAHEIAIQTLSAAKIAHGIDRQTLQFAQTVHKSMPQAETIAALQTIAQSSIHTTKTEDLVRIMHASIAASNIATELEINKTLENIPISQMHRLLQLWKPPYMPPFAAYGLSANASPVSESKQQIRTRKLPRPRTRLIRRLAKQDFLQTAAVSLVLVQATSPEILESIKDFAQTPACADLLSLLSSSACIGAEYLSPKDRKTLLWIVWLFTVLFILGK